MEINKSFFQKLKYLTPEEDISALTIAKIKRERKITFILGMVSTVTILFFTPAAIISLLTEIEFLGTIDLLRLYLEDSRFFLDNSKEFLQLFLTSLPISGFSVNIALLTVLAVVIVKIRRFANILST